MTKTLEVRIEVSQEDIDLALELHKGTKDTIFGRDPISLAAKRGGLEAAGMAWAAIAYGPSSNRKFALVPEHVQEFDKRFCHREPVEPIAFNLKIEREV
jgi:hypothetical protein